MKIKTHEIDANLLNIEKSTAVYVKMDDTQVIEIDENDDIGDILMYTEGIGPCISIILFGKVLDKNKNEQKFVAMNHWSGGTIEEIQSLSHLNQTDCGKELARNCLTYLLKEIVSEFSSNDNDEDIILLDDIAILGGEQAQESLSGTEMQVQGLKNFLKEGAVLTQKNNSAIKIPILMDNNIHTFKTSANKDMDVYVLLGEDSTLNVQYVIRDGNELQYSHEESLESTEEKNVGIESSNVKKRKKASPPEGYTSKFQSPTHFFQNLEDHTQEDESNQDFKKSKTIHINSEINAQSQKK